MKNIHRDPKYITINKLLNCLNFRLTSIDGTISHMHITIKTYRSDKRSIESLSRTQKPVLIEPYPPVLKRKTLICEKATDSVQSAKATNGTNPRSI